MLATPDDENEGMEVLVALTGNDASGGAEGINVAVDLSSNAIIAASVCATFLAILVSTLVFFCCCCYYRRSRNKPSGGLGIPNPETGDLKLTTLANTATKPN